MKHPTTPSKLNKTALVWALALTLVLALVIVPYSYAVFTNSMHAQRTIAAYDAVGDRFSSNYLAAGNNSRDNVRTIYVTDNSHSPTAVVSVCNYDQGKQTRPNDTTISYTVTARLVKRVGENYEPINAAYLTSEGLTAYTITVSDDSTDVVLGTALQSTSFSGTLTGGVADSDVYTVTFTTNFAVATPPNLYLEMVVVPTDPGTQLPQLCGIIATGLRAAGASTSWAGSFSDSTDDAPSAYDGYNYVIEGTGTGTFTLKWNNTKVALSYESIRMLNCAVTTVGNISTIAFAVNSSTVDRYDLQFYRKNITSETWASSMNEHLATAGTAPAAVVGYFFVPT